ncbi:hypothetical protein CJP46_33105 [Paenibacillus sp. XY044]|nr:hypothetical protein CJP46_33105 [Paenibacillus sp. XY044]
MNIVQTLEIIYLDKSSRITRRKIEVRGIRDVWIRPKCLSTEKPRVFLPTSILPWQPAREECSMLDDTQFKLHFQIHFSRSL